MTFTHADINNFSSIPPHRFFEVETIGAGRRYACESDFYDDEATARFQALRRSAICPEYCTRLLATDLTCRTSLLWASRPDPDDDPEMPVPPRGSFEPD